MRNFDFNRLFNNNTSSTAKAKTKRRRVCRLEELEPRELLAVDAAEFLLIRDQYTDLNLGDYADYNIIDLDDLGGLTEANLRAAITTAGTTTQNDLIVARTTTGQPSTITLNISELAIDIDAALFGSITIVSFGGGNLTIDANGQSEGFHTGVGSTTAFGGLTIIDSGGAGIWNDGNMTITECTIANNSGYDGGGIYQWQNGTSLTVTNSTFTGNTSTRGGGGVHTSGGTATLINVVITGNTAGGGGGGIFNSTTLTLIDCTISGNTADSSDPNNVARGEGGGINNFGGTLTLTNCKITGNTATEDGGGIYNSDNGEVTAINCLIVKNTATGDGGGVFNSGTITITHGTIADNSAGGVGGGIRTSTSNTTGHLFLNNSIVVENGGNDISLNGTMGGTINLSGYYTNSVPGTSLLYDPSLPLFVDAANGDYHLADGSQAIDSGNNGFVVNTILYDLDGNTRLINGTVDIGAYEYGGAVTPPTNPPATPTGLQAINTTQTSITLAWDAVVDADTYEIQYRQAGTQGWTTITAITGTTTIVPGLQANTNYEFQICAVNANGTSAWSTPSLSVTTGTTVTPPPSDTPLGLHSTVQISRAITLQWEALPGVTGYLLQYKVTGTNVWLTAPTPVVKGNQVQTAAAITNLNVNTSYDIRLTAYIAGTAPEVATLTARTHSGTASSGTTGDKNTGGGGSTGDGTTGTPVTPTTPAAAAAVKPSKVKVDKKATSLSTVTLTWATNDRNAEYRIVCTSHSNVETITVIGNKAVIEGLQANTRYKFSVIAVNADGKESAKTVVSAKTLKYAAVKRLKAVKGAQTLTTVTLTWNASAVSETTRYVVEVYDAKGKTPISTAVVNVEGTSALITGLSPTTRYTFVVKAVADDLEVESMAAKVRVSTAKYAAVAKVRASEKTDKTVDLSWTDPKEMAETVYYEISWMQDGTEKFITATVPFAQITDLQAFTKYVFTVRAVAEVDGTLVRSLSAKTTVRTMKEV